MAERVLLVRHGETAWSRLGRHTGRTDVELTEEGRRMARVLGARLAGEPWELLPGAQVRSSPMSRAWETCELVGLGERAERWDLLREWDYGAYEGLTAEEVQQRFDPSGERSWTLWQDGPEGGESVVDLARRADLVLEWVRQQPGDVVLFAHGHLLRMLGTRWLDQPPTFGGHLRLSPASLSVLSWAHGLPVWERWNDTGHLD
ncbi:histidine phosphatase family protein [Streptomyces sp. NPDC005438]|uniref:histidine phosphatase family protein n=1 Tax=Streptomyces sp. NPDC005438 TaxID=3156880 RepID=UPI0033B48135